MMRQPLARLAFHAENPHRKPADRGSDPIAIEFKRSPILSKHVTPNIHFHAVDDGEEILLPQTEGLHRFGESSRKSAWLHSGIEARNVRAPAIQAGNAVVICAAIVGDVVHGAAEGVDLVHRVALLARENSKSAVERAAGYDRLGGYWRMCLLQNAHRPRSGREGFEVRVSRAPSVSPAPCMPSTNAACFERCTRSRKGSLVSSVAVRRCASLTMAPVSRPSRVSFTARATCAATGSKPALFSATEVRQARNAGEDLAALSSSTRAPQACIISSGR